MSRIHEALKKAELERGAARSDGSTPVATLDQPQAPMAATTMVEEHPQPDSPEAMLSRCASPLWTPEPKLSALFAPSSGHAEGTEELRTLRSRLYQIRDKQPLRSLLVTSAMPGEGKTFLTACLARMIARQAGRRVLIIDADLRRPQMHTVLGAPNAHGLTEYLAGQADESSVIQRGPDKNLFLLPSGRTASNAAELLANGRLPQLLRKLESVFDWILLDSPPVVPVHDASVMAGFCDGVILVVRSASTAYDLAQRARVELQDKGLLGAVLNHVEHGSTYQSYYYYYGQNDKTAEAPKS
ncbi:MAG: CpsD/CapB family tyrosine-protein kinase [Acidobacteria bacterium]|nr:CpsD/CapB family tyrosine-protein kinase [Acidobacteriota bacterium]